MNKNRPVIGITAGYNYDKKLAFIKEGYCEGVNEAGGIAIMLPLTDNEEILLQMIDTCDGFLLTGGPDVDAKYFDEENLPFNQEISPIRDAVELFIAKKAIKLNKSVLGICRGIQVMNVALGGNLYQDIHAQIKDSILIKHSQDAPKWYPTHKVSIKRGSKLWNTCKNDIISVNSFHHQAIKDVAKDCQVTAKSSDGIIEAIEHIENKFAVGVQWHPELMWQSDPEFLNLFKDFIISCKT